MADEFIKRKFEVIEQIVGDRRATHLDVRLGVLLLTRYMSRDLGYAWPYQQTLAADLGITRRGVQLALDRLEHLGHVVVERAKGRGHPSRYRMPEKANPGSPITDERANGGSPINPTKGEQEFAHSVEKGEHGDTKRRTETQEKANGHSHQEPFKNPFYNPSRGRASGADALAPLRALLDKRIGPEKTRSWFGNVELVDVSADTLRLSFPSKYQRKYVAEQFETDVLACSQALHPTVVRVDMVLKQEAA